MDLYVSKTWLNNISKAGVGAIMGAVGFLFGGLIGSSVVSAISSIISGGNFQHGRVFVVRGGVYQYYYLQ